MSIRRPRAGPKNYNTTKAIIAGVDLIGDLGSFLVDDEQWFETTQERGPASGEHRHRVSLLVFSLLVIYIPPLSSVDQHTILAFLHDR